tara:strand:+ start:2319 stop:2462 length:144 start_codon:yes stop_codon:yes gene_type:complete
MAKKSSGAGKGDNPRSCFSKKFKDNYDKIDWKKESNKKAKNENDKTK